MNTIQQAFINGTLKYIPNKEKKRFIDGISKLQDEDIFKLEYAMFVCSITDETILKYENKRVLCINTPCGNTYILAGNVKAQLEEIKKDPQTTLLKQKLASFIS